MRSGFRDQHWDWGLVTGWAAMAAAAVMAALTLAMAGPAAAQTAVPVADDRQAVDLEVSKGRLFQLIDRAQSVFIADGALAEVNVVAGDKIYIYGRQPGQTDVIVLNSAEDVIASLDVTITAGTAPIEAAIAAVAGGGGVRVGRANNDIVLSGTAPSPIVAAEIVRTVEAFAPSPDNVINRLRVTGSNQVNLQVQVAEVTRDVARALGVNIGALIDGGDVVFSVVPNLLPASLGVGGPLGGVSTLIAGDIDLGNVEIDVLIDALEEEGLVTVLSEPNLTALSGATASFLAGGEFPIPVAQDEDTITIEFRSFGVSLAFTPTVLEDGAINMRVRPEVSALSTDGAIITDAITIPSLTTRRADTTIEVASGQSFAIAGLLQNNVTHDLRGGQRPELLHRWAAAELVHRGRRQVPVPGRSAGVGRVVPVQPVRKPRIRTGDHRHPLPGRADRSRPAAGAQHPPGPGRGPGRAGGQPRTWARAAGRLHSEIGGRDMMIQLNAIPCALFAALALPLAGCVAAPASLDARTDALYAFDTVSLDHQVVFAAGSTELDPVALGTLNGFLDRAGVEPGDRVAVSAGGLLAEGRQNAVVIALASRWIGAARLPGAGQEAGTTVTVTAQRTVARPNDCGLPPVRALFSPNLLQPHGCATRTNLAAQVERLDDLRRGRTVAPRAGVPAVQSVENLFNDELPELQFEDFDE